MDKKGKGAAMQTLAEEGYLENTNLDILENME